METLECANPSLLFVRMDFCRMGNYKWRKPVGGADLRHKVSTYQASVPLRRAFWRKCYLLLPITKTKWTSAWLTPLWCRGQGHSGISFITKPSAMMDRAGQGRPPTSGEFWGSNHTGWQSTNGHLISHWPAVIPGWHWGLWHRRASGPAVEEKDYKHERQKGHQWEGSWSAGREGHWTKPKVENGGGGSKSQ